MHHLEAAKQTEILFDDIKKYLREVPIEVLYFPIDNYITRINIALRIIHKDYHYSTLILLDINNLFLHSNLLSVDQQVRANRNEMFAQAMRQIFQKTPSVKRNLDFTRAMWMAFLFRVERRYPYSWEVDTSYRDSNVKQIEPSIITPEVPQNPQDGVVISSSPQTAFTAVTAVSVVVFFRTVVGIVKDTVGTKRDSVGIKKDRLDIAKHDRENAEREAKAKDTNKSDG